MYTGSALQHELATVDHEDRITSALKRNQYATASNSNKRRAGGNRMYTLSENRIKLAVTGALVALVMAMGVFVHTHTSELSANSGTPSMSISALHTGPAATSSHQEGAMYVQTGSAFTFLLAGL